MLDLKDRIKENEECILPIYYYIHNIIQYIFYIIQWIFCTCVIYNK